MTITTIYLTGRTFDKNGVSNGWEEVPARVLEGVTLNGLPIWEDDLDRKWS